MFINEEKSKLEIIDNLPDQDAGLPLDVKTRAGKATDQGLVGPGVLIGDELGEKLRVHQLDTWGKTLTRLCPRCGS